MFGTWNCGCKGVRPLKILININTVETKSTYMIQKHCELSFYDANIFPVTYLRTVFRRNWIFLPDHSLRSSYLLSTLKTTISSSKHQENSTKYLNLKVDSTSTYRGELNVLKLLFFTTPGSRDSQEVVRSELELGILPSVTQCDPPPTCRQPSWKLEGSTSLVPIFPTISTVLE